eukprot:gnl/Dysnectes_brevis/631_a698_3637.p1 GENE.gnl/Dysnectes_brevis/631_a698_3637~~gnl/Dysnectes_brevis/631_a698_3637.p1  ORF type:complete len:146 (-),score=14.80 gnl/Dysnectes_brevis/631_a698_3637:272-709(-)
MAETETSTTKFGISTFVNFPEIESTIKAIVDDSAEVSWCILSLDAKKQISLTESGVGGWTCFTESLQADSISWVIYRLKDSRFHSSKLGLIWWSGASSPRRLRIFAGNYTHDVVKCCRHLNLKNINANSVDIIKDKLMSMNLVDE